MDDEEPPFDVNEEDDDFGMDVDEAFGDRGPEPEEDMGAFDDDDDDPPGNQERGPPLLRPEAASLDDDDDDGAAALPKGFLRRASPAKLAPKAPEEPWRSEEAKPGLFAPCRNLLESADRLKLREAYTPMKQVKEEEEPEGVWRGFDSDGELADKEVEKVAKRPLRLDCGGAAEKSRSSKDAR